MSAVYPDRSAREAFQVLLQKRKLQSIGLHFLPNKQKRPNEPGDVLHENADSGGACEPSALGAAAAPGEQAREQGRQQAREAGTYAAAPGASACGACDAGGGTTPLAAVPALARGAVEPRGVFGSLMFESIKAPPPPQVREQDHEQGSPSTGAAAAAKNIVLPSFWQEMTKILEDQDRWISMRMQEVKTYSLSAHTDPRHDTDAGELFDCFNDNTSWEHSEYGGLNLWQE